MAKSKVNAGVVMGWFQEAHRLFSECKMHSVVDVQPCFSYFGCAEMHYQLIIVASCPESDAFDKILHLYRVGMVLCLTHGKISKEEKESVYKKFSGWIDHLIQVRRGIAAGEKDPELTRWLRLSLSGKSRNMKHGHRGTKESRTYVSWKMMRQRCLNRYHEAFRWYGAQGVKIDPRWDSFQNFLADMGERPEGTSLDRIDPMLDYCKENCRWADAPTQQANRRKKKTT